MTNTATDTRPVMHLDSLAVPNVSASQSWLEAEAAKRATAVEVLAATTKAWFGIPYLPDTFWTAFAEHAVKALDQRA
jgi:hypothetical protein